MNTKPILLAIASLTLAVGSGCASARGTSVVDTPKYSIEDTETFVVLDRPTQLAIGCTGLQEIRLPDGRLQVVANIKNRDERRIQVQINCIFRDDQGFSTGDETPFQTLILSGNATEAVRFAAMNPLAKKYTIRVRSAR